MSEDTSTGATPGAGAMPAQPETTAPPATGEDGLADAGRAILREARATAKAAEARAHAAEVERDALKAATQTETERLVTAARKEGAAEVMTKVQAQLRRAGVKSALITAGVNTELLDLATKDDVFADLSVTDEGDVDGLDAAIASLRKARPSLFTKVTPGDFGGGNRGATPDAKPSMSDLLRAAARG